MVRVRVRGAVLECLTTVYWRSRGMLKSKADMLAITCLYLSISAIFWENGVGVGVGGREGEDVARDVATIHRSY